MISNARAVVVGGGRTASRREALPRLLGDGEAQHREEDVRCHKNSFGLQLNFEVFNIVD